MRESCYFLSRVSDKEIIISRLLVRDASSFALKFGAVKPFCRMIIGGFNA